MTADVLARDHGFRQWLAARPGLWLEVGVFDDAGQLVALMAERRRLHLPAMAALRAPRPPRRQHRGAAVARLAAIDTIGGHA